ncbi:uncharacterized protein JCM15063_005727 [Sporobolomyces koalae]|uniref:uncharacterized protein n=1 Tax=Sporobolomyces koalae TaxID=500713 RepID=UPI00316B27CA
MLPFSRPAAFNLTNSTPLLLTYGEGISPKHTLNIHDVDGHGKEWTVQASVSKVSIYNSKNLTLRLPGRIVTSTMDIWKASNLTVIIGSGSDSASSPLGTLQLDPTLEDVHIEYVDSAAVGRIVIAPLLSSARDGSASFGFRDVTLQAGNEERFLLADRSGTLFDPTERDQARAIEPTETSARSLGAQLVVSWKDGWHMTGLERGAMDYPILS